MYREHYIPIHLSMYPQPYYPQYHNYMRYIKPMYVIPDCVCDPYETFGQCQIRKRIFKCNGLGYNN